MSSILNKKISTMTGIIVILVVATFFGWLIIKEYQKVIEMRFEPIELKSLEK